MPNLVTKFNTIMKVKISCATCKHVNESYTEKLTCSNCGRPILITNFNELKIKDKEKEKGLLFILVFVMFILIVVVIYNSFGNSNNGSVNSYENSSSGNNSNVKSIVRNEKSNIDTLSNISTSNINNGIKSVKYEIIRRPNGGSGDFDFMYIVYVTKKINKDETDWIFNDIINKNPTNDKIAIDIWDSKKAFYEELKIYEEEDKLYDEGKSIKGFLDSKRNILNRDDKHNIAQYTDYGSDISKTYPDDMK